jgi:hypothetical protein
MIDHDELTEGYRNRLRDAVEEAAARETDWPALYPRLAHSVSSRLHELRRRAPGGRRATAVVGAAWWDFAARAALAALPLGLAAALLLLTFLLRSGGESASDARPAVPSSTIAGGSADSARAAFESVLTGAEAPQAAMATLIPVPPAAFLAEAPGGRAR